MQVIENDYLRATVHPHGAELRSLIDKSTGQEVLWQRDPAYWAKTSPVLFPFIGMLRNNSYTYTGITWPMTKHGFARDQGFELLEQAPDHLVFRYCPTKEMQAVYPFSYELLLTYRLTERTIECRYEVRNTHETTMYFSIGGHPAINLPMGKGKTLNDYYVQFPKDRILHRHPIEEGFLMTKWVAEPLEDGKLYLQDDLFAQDAWVLTELQSTEVLLKNRQGDFQIRVQFGQFPYLGLWAPVGAPFLCIEPWHGLNDEIGHSGELKDKKGIIPLAGNQHWQAAWSILVDKTAQSPAP